MKKLRKKLEVLFETVLIKIALLYTDRKEAVKFLDFFWGENLHDEFGYRHNLNFEVLLRLSKMKLWLIGILFK